VKDAATVVLLRERVGETEVFLVRRHGQSAFMGGAHVFPGGKLDEADREIEALVADRSVARELEPTPGKELSESHAIGLFAAACRELFEEAGVLIADGASPSLAQWRKKLNAGEATFAEMCRAERLVPRLDRLIYFAHWVTPSLEQRRYDTRFFLVELPEGQEPAHDEHETTEQAWLTPSAALAAQERGEMFLPPPTQRTLEELGSGPPSEVLGRAKQRRIAAILPKVVVIDQQFTILLPWDPDYAATDGESLAVPVPHPNAASPSRMTVRLS
jgi:8-oxo-dGTP pyrophosphatase MutT (NUDIX family)